MDLDFCWWDTASVWLNCGAMLNPKEFVPVLNLPLTHFSVQMHASCPLSLLFVTSVPGRIIEIAFGIPWLHNHWQWPELLLFRVTKNNRVQRKGAIWYATRHRHLIELWCVMLNPEECFPLSILHLTHFLYRWYTRCSLPLHLVTSVVGGIIEISFGITIIYTTTDNDPNYFSVTTISMLWNQTIIRRIVLQQFK